MDLWAWAGTAFAKPAVAETGLALQDAHGQSISFLLWAAWARPDAAAAARGADLARAWSYAAIAPLREARRGLKAAMAPIDDASREALRETVRGAELASERLLLEALSKIAGEGDGPRLAAITTASAAWGPPAPDAALAAFAEALG